MARPALRCALGGCDTGVQMAGHGRGANRGIAWRHAGVNAGAKLAQDTVRFLGAPVWCLRYFPLDLYLQAVGLEALYYAIRLAAVVSSTVTGGAVFRRYRQAA